MATTVSRLTSTGSLFISGSFDEVSYNPNGGFDGYIAYTAGSLTPNLVRYSQALDTVSTYSTSSVTLTPNATIAPDGTLTGALLREDTSVNSPHAFTFSAVGLSTNTQYVLSCYFKPYSNDRRINYQFHTNPATSYAQEFLDVTMSTIDTTATVTGVFTNPSGSITSATNGWYRASLSATIGTNTNIQFVILLYNALSQNYTGNGTSGVYIWGPQVQPGSQATAYVPTSATDALATGTTNLFRSTTNISTTAWSNYSATSIISLTTDTTAPDGSLSAYKFVALNGIDPNANNASILSQNNNYGQVNSGSVYTQSIFFKAAELNKLRIRNNASGEIYDFTIGTTPTGTSGVLAPQLRAIDNGWYRASWSFVAGDIGGGGGRSDNWSLRSASTGDGTSGVYIWGPQLQAGYNLSPYIAIGPTLYQSVNNFIARTNSQGNVYTANILDEYTIQDTVDTVSGTVVALTTAGSGTWTVPLDWTTSSNVIHLIGGGAGGSGGFALGAGLNGGGGGGYTKITNLALTPGSTVSYTVGSGGNGGDAGITGYGTVGSSTVFLSYSAGGGGVGQSSPRIGGIGATYNGGNGGLEGQSLGVFGAVGAGGGGAAGPYGNGLNATEGGLGGTGDAGFGGTASATTGTEINGYGSGGGNSGLFGGGGVGGDYISGTPSSGSGGARGAIIIVYNQTPKTTKIKQSTTGTLQIAGEFDEVTGIF